MIVSTWGDWKTPLCASQFDGSTRIEFYDMLTALLENDVGVSDALHELEKIWSDGGKNPNSPLAVVANSCRRMIGSGKSFSTAMSHWVPSQEATLIAAGEKAGGMIKSFEDCRRLIEAKRQNSGCRGWCCSLPNFPAGCSRGDALCNCD
ncbi:type II secretion system F family protein [Pseudomonas sp. JG-B]|nr:type II secretion system F family protein [Pseudomonas sp. JG-B]